MVVLILGTYVAFGVVLIEVGGVLLYAGLILIVLVALIAGNSFLEYMHTSPHLRTMHALPLQNSQIIRLAEEVANRFRLQPPEVYITHYDVPNAFTLGRKKTPLLVITDGLLDLSYDEVKAVFAHELAHVKSNDSLIKTVASVMRKILFYDPVIRFAYSKIYVEKEFVADERSAIITGKPEDLVSALRKIYKEVSEFGEGLPPQSVLNFSQKVHSADSIRLQQGIPADPIVKNRFIVERKMMPGSVVQERVKRLKDMKKRLKKTRPTK